MDEKTSNNYILRDFKRDPIIEEMIFSIRNNDVMIETKVLNQAVKRNQRRFPHDFVFRLNDDEKMELVTKCDRFESLKHSSSNPYAFNEHGVTMLTSVLKSEIAINISIQIVKAFVELRKRSTQNGELYKRIYHLEERQTEIEDHFELILNEFSKNDQIHTQGIFFDGQMFDAHVFASDLIKTAKTSIILIDNYIDEETLKLFSVIRENVKLIFYTSKLQTKNELAIKRFQEQFPATQFHVFKRSHDRFLIIDKKEIYHIGASLKDLGKKWFAFTRLDIPPAMILERLNR
jgi:hypothetical protein